MTPDYIFLIMMNFELRPWNLDDLSSLVEQANNPRIARFMTDQFPHPYTPENGKNFISMASGRNPQTIMAIAVDGKAVGGIGLHPQQDIYCRNAEMGYWLGEAYWGHGIMTRAIIEMIKYGFGLPGIDRIFARPFATNLPSQKVLQKAGFVLEATLTKSIFKNGESIDECIYATRRPGI